MSDTQADDSMALALHKANTLRMNGKVADFETEVTSGNWYLVFKVWMNDDFEDVRDELTRELEPVDGIDYAGQENPAGTDYVYLKFTDHGRFQ